MSRLTITIDMDNAAFDGDPMIEATRIIRGWLNAGAEPMKLRDSNGNTVGKVTVTA